MHIEAECLRWCWSNEHAKEDEVWLTSGYHFNRVWWDSQQ